MKKPKAHAVALFSGGLDSALAILLLLKQDIKVTAITFMTHFGCDLGDRSSCGSNPYPAAEKFGFDVKLMHLSDKFIEIVKNPKHGRGKNMNPCTDCRILMLREAKDLMEMIDADFIVTGEVVGQRPMSQLREKIRLVEKESDLVGKLLRPLCAKLLPQTEPELNGMVDREQLEGISGRSRKRQIELAAELGLEDYPNPASGCLLTDDSYSNRLRDLLSHTEHITFNDLNLLRLGRHFRLDNETKIIVGKDEKDNNSLENYMQEHHFHLEAIGIGSPVTLLIGNASEENLTKAAMITARYSAGKKSDKIDVSLVDKDPIKTFTVEPVQKEELDSYRI